MSISSWSSRIYSSEQYAMLPLSFRPSQHQGFMQRNFIQIHDLRPFQHHQIPINETTILQEAVTLAHSVKKNSLNISPPSELPGVSCLCLNVPDCISYYPSVPHRSGAERNEQDSTPEVLDLCLYFYDVIIFHIYLFHSCSMNLLTRRLSERISRKTHNAKHIFATSQITPHAVFRLRIL